jgi:2-C-methyl-D-erythritol 4-phosphate cytidylyltransferase
MGGARKALLELAGEPVLVHALRPLLADPRVAAIRVALADDDAAHPPSWLTALDDRVRVVAGGATRADSVARAVEALPDEVEVILVHDAARPLVTAAVVDRVISEAAAGRGAIAGWPATDTLKRVDAGRRVIGTPERDTLWHAQTPQGFPASWLREALADAQRRADATDDASLVEALGHEVVMVEGSRWNLKVTTPDDLPVASALLARAPHARGPRPSGSKPESPPSAGTRP